MKSLLKNIIQPDKLEGKLFHAVALTLWLSLFIYTFVKLFHSAQGLVFFGLVWMFLAVLGEYSVKIVDVIFAIIYNRPVNRFSFREEKSDTDTALTRLRTYAQALRDRKSNNAG